MPERTPDESLRELSANIINLDILSEYFRERISGPPTLGSMLILAIREANSNSSDGYYEFSGIGRELFAQAGLDSEIIDALFENNEDGIFKIKFGTEEEPESYDNETISIVNQHNFGVRLDSDKPEQFTSLVWDYTGLSPVRLSAVSFVNSFSSRRLDGGLVSDLRNSLALLKAVELLVQN